MLNKKESLRTPARAPEAYNPRIASVQTSKFFGNTNMLCKRTQQRRIDFKSVNQTALSHAELICRELLLTGRKFGCEFVALNPRREDKHLGSFRLNIKTGKWSDFATGDKGGDLISYVAYVKNVGQLQAALFLAERLGVRCHA